MLIVLITIFTVNSRAEIKYLMQTSEDLKAASRPFAAAFYLQEYLKNHKEQKFHSNYEHLLSLIDLVGYSVFDDLSLFEVKLFPFAAMYYHSLKALVFKKNYKKAYEIFKQFPGEYKKSPVFLQLHGFTSYMLNKNEEAEKSFESCIKERRSSKSPHFMSDHNYQLVIEQCHLYLARVYYRSGSYQKSLRSYQEIDINSQYYPLIAIEKAWCYYQLKDYDRVLALNLAFESSWMKPFYDGEIDILASLSLVKLCRWDDTFYFLSRMHLKSNHMIATINKIEFYLEDNLGEILIGKRRKPKKLTEAEYKVLKKMELSSYWNKIYLEYLGINKEVISKNTMLIDKVDGKRLNTFLYNKKEQTLSLIREYYRSEADADRRKLYSMKEQADGLELEILARYRNTIYKHDDGLETLGDKSEVKTQTSNERSDKTPVWAYSKEHWRDEVDQYRLHVPSLCRSDEKELKL